VVTETAVAADLSGARRLLVRAAEVLYERRLTELQGGNMSVRIADMAAVTPTKASEETGWRLAPGDTLVQTLTGEVLVGDPSRVSREIRLHLRLYRSFDDVGAVIHLHLPEAIAAAAAARWAPGIVPAAATRFGASVVLLETGLRGQTEPHDSRVVELLGQVPRDRGALSISPTHGVFCVAPDMFVAIKAADVFRQRLESERLRGRLRAAREGGVA
jgi:ribulose-5-phosphate 4-epimerase/fuculose-1-phosphate aldolase